MLLHLIYTWNCENISVIVGLKAESSFKYK